MTPTPVPRRLQRCLCGRLILPGQRYLTGTHGHLLCPTCIHTLTEATRKKETP